MGDNDVEAVGCSTLKDYHQTFSAKARVGGAKSGARQKARQRGCAHYSKRSVA
jgi:uncharacterized protein YciW